MLKHAKMKSKEHNKGIKMNKWPQKPLEEEGCDLHCDELLFFTQGSQSL